MLSILHRSSLASFYLPLEYLDFHHNLSIMFHRTAMLLPFFLLVTKVVASPSPSPFPDQDAILEANRDSIDSEYYHMMMRRDEDGIASAYEYESEYCLSTSMTMNSMMMKALCKCLILLLDFDTDINTTGLLVI